MQYSRLPECVLLWQICQGTFWDDAYGVQEQAQQIAAHVLLSVCVRLSLPDVNQTASADNQLPANVRDIGRTSRKKAFSEPSQILENQYFAEG